MAGTHSRKSPSGAKRLHGCPGALTLIDTLPPEQRSSSGWAARLGTAAHFLLEKCLRELKSPEEFRDRIIELLGDQEDGSMLRPMAKMPTDVKRLQRCFVVDDSMIRGVHIAVNYVMTRCEELGFDPAKLQLETRTNPVPERDDTDGTADVTIDIWPTYLEVVDYKNGRNVVEHEDNPQLLAYLAGKAQESGWSHDKYAITVIQPNADHEEGWVRTFDISREDLQAFVGKHRRAAELADEAADAFVGSQTEPVGAGVGDAAGEMANVPWGEMFTRPGEWCDNCDASFICLAKKRWLQKQASMDFDDDPHELTPVSGLPEAAKVIGWAGRMFAHIKQARELADSQIKAGAKDPQLKVIRSKGRGAWKDPSNPHALVAQLVKDGYLSDNEREMAFEPAKLLSGPKVEKLITGKRDGVTQTARRQAFRQAYMETKPGKLKVVHISVPGEPVVVSAADEFDDDPGGDE